MYYYTTFIILCLYAYNKTWLYNLMRLITTLFFLENSPLALRQSCYENLGKNTWHNGRTECALRGGHMLALETQEEFDLMTGAFNVINIFCKFCAHVIQLHIYEK